MKKRKIVAYAAVPVLALGLAGATASAFGGFGMSSAAPEEIAERQSTMFESHAELLGLGVEEVKAAWAEGRSMRELAEEKGIDDETLRARMQAERLERMKEHLDALVSQGVVTRSQADSHYETMKERIESGKRNGNGPGMGMGMHRGGGFGGMF